MTTPNLRKSILPSLVSPDGPFVPTSTELDTRSELPPLPPPSATGEVAPFSGASVSNADLADSFRPDERMTRCRAKYWARMADRPLAGGTAPTLALAQQITQSASLAGWWRRPGFAEWFANERSSAEQIDWLFSLALNAAEDILKNEDPKAQGARVAMVKTVAELAGRLRPQGASPEDKKRKAIEAMSAEELKKLLSASGVRYETVGVLDVAIESAIKE